MFFLRIFFLDTLIWSSFEDINIVKGTKINKQGKLTSWKLDEDNEVTPVFHENKVYLVPCSQVKKQPEATIQEIDLRKIEILLVLFKIRIETMNCREIKVPGKPTTNFFWKFCNQLVDGKICALTGKGHQGPEATHRDIWAYDLSKFLLICNCFLQAINRLQSMDFNWNERRVSNCPLPCSSGVL